MNARVRGAATRGERAARRLTSTREDEGSPGGGLDPQNGGGALEVL